MRKSIVIPALILVASLALGAAAGQAPVAAQSAAPATREQSLQLLDAARTLGLAGRRDDALTAYTEAIESHQLDRDQQARALFDRGLLLDGMDRLSDALQDYTGALSLSQKFAAALNNRANIYRRLRRFGEAERDYRASLAAGNPKSEYPYYGLGQIAEAEGKKDQARALYAKALASDPDFVLARQKAASLEEQKTALLDQPIDLHPPAPKGVRAEAAAARPALRSESPKPIHLRPPIRPAAALPAAYEHKSPALKPALDGAESHLGGQVQLGAWRSQAEAEQGWDRAVKQAGAVLDGYSPHIVAADLPQAGRYYRLRLAAGRDGAKSLCAALSAKGLACIPARD